MTMFPNSVEQSETTMLLTNSVVYRIYELTNVSVANNNVCVSYLWINQCKCC